MSRLAIPVSRTILHSTGDVLLKAHVMLALKDSAGNFPRALLQPLALLDCLKFTMDKDPTSAAIYGEVIIEKK